jgi:predicted component of type VI protein secretion system
MKLRLVVTNKESKESSNFDLTIDDKITIGRHLGSPVLMQGDGLSRHHFSLGIAEGVLTLEDLSSNGTWLNGALLKAQMSAPVKSGDIIEVPGYEMLVMIQTYDAPQSVQSDASVPLSSAKAKPAWMRPLVAAFSFFEPREVTLILLAVASIALICFFLNN